MSCTPSDKFLDWLQNYSGIDLTGYTPSRGIWIESDATASKRYLGVFTLPGRSFLVGEVQFPQIRLIVTGTKDGRSIGGQVAEVEKMAHDIMSAALSVPGNNCIAAIRPLGGIQGPFFTDVNRPFYEQNFELTY
ncbi:hypothetical protein D9M71_602220 [compost metagenome]